MTDLLYTADNLPPNTRFRAKLKSKNGGLQHWTYCREVLTECKMQIGLTLFTLHPGDVLIVSGKDQGVARSIEFLKYYTPEYGYEYGKAVRV